MRHQMEALTSAEVNFTTNKKILLTLHTLIHMVLIANVFLENVNEKTFPSLYTVILLLKIFEIHIELGNSLLFFTIAGSNTCIVEQI